MKAQTKMFSKGYNPRWSEGAAIPPVFRTSTFVFENCEEGKRAFEIAYGISEKKPGEIPALIYSRVNNPNMQMVEDRIVEWDGAEAAALFSSGMGAISTTILALLRPGDTLLFSDPVYGGTEYFFRHMLPLFGIKAVPFEGGSSKEVIDAAVRAEKNVKMIYLESPANPTMVLTDMKAAVEIAAEHSKNGNKILTFVDNTFLGPIFSKPLSFGVDLITYSATKFIGGHSDIVAGITLGSEKTLAQVKGFRTILGSNSDPDTAWLILRSLGTLELRMKKQMENAQGIVDFLAGHKAVRRVAYPGRADFMGEYQAKLFNEQFTGAGSVISFCIQGGEKEAFKVLDNLKDMRLAVSLGGIETLIEHPYTMTHSDMTADEKRRAGISDCMIRLSVGLEDPEDLIADLEQSLNLIL